jgi:transposase
MSQYSPDFRLKIVTAYFTDDEVSIRKVAERFSISTKTVTDLLRQYRETQDLTPKKPGPAKGCKLDAHREFIHTMVNEHPDWTLRQYCDHLLEHREIYSSVSTMCEFLKKENLTLKKRLIGERRLPVRRFKSSD